MNKKFTKMAAAVALLFLFVLPMKVMGQERGESALTTLPDNPQWVATALANISDDATVIIISNSTSASNIALPSTTTSSSPKQKACTVSTSNNITTIAPPANTSLQDLAWTLKKVTSGNSTTYKFYQEGSNSVRLYLTGTSSNTALRVGDANSSNDQFVLGSNGDLLKLNNTTARYVGPYKDGDDWRTYTTENANNYASASLTFYVLQTTSSSSYTLTYKANNGSATADVTESVSSGGSTTLKPSNTFSFDGHTFYKWNTAANGTGTDYEASTTLSNITSDYTFYARWNYNVAVSTVQGVTIKPAYNSNYLTGSTNAVPRGAQIGLSVEGLETNQQFVWSILKSSDNSNVTSQVLSGTTLTVPDYDIIIGGSVVQEDPSFEIVFAATNNGGNCQANNGSWNVTGGSLALSCAANSSSGAPAYNSNSEELRIYGNANGGGSITLTPTTVSITKVVLTASTGYANAVKYYINGASSGTDLSWSGTTGTVDNINGYITFQNAENGTTQVRIKKIKIYYSVPETFTPTVDLNDNNYGTLAGPTENVYTVTPNAGYKIVDFTKTDNVTVTQLTGDAFSASTYRIIATAANQTVTFNLAQRTGTTVTLHDGLNGSTTTAVNTYKDATLADVIEGHEIASVNGWTALGWVKSYTSGDPTLITTTEAVGETTNLYAVYKKGSNTFSRITSTDDLAVDGVYMICYNSSTTYKFMDDVSSNYMGNTDANSVSENSFEYVAGKKFTLGGSTGAYTLYDGSKYLTATSGQQYLGLASGSTDDVAKWTITFDNNNAKIKNNGLTGNNVYVSYYASNNYFNMYTNYSTIYLFKQITNNLQYSIAPTAELCHVYYNANGATTGNVPEDNTGYNPNTNVTILGNTGTLAKTGYTWSGWCLNAEGTGTVYGPTPYTTTYILQENTTFYAKWVVNSHDWSTDLTNAVLGTTVQLKVNNAAVAANTQIAFGTEVTVEVSVPDGYIYSVSVNDGAVSFTNGKFTMPDADVVVAVTTQDNPYRYATLSSSDMAGMTLAEETDPLAYGKLKYTTVNGFYWETNGQQANATGTTNRLGMIQLRDRTKTENSYIKLPVFNGKIESVVLAVTNGSAEASNGAVCKATFDFQTNNASDGAIVVQGGNSTDGTSEVTLDLSEKFCNTGYIKIHNNSNAARIWNITVTYLPYNNFTDLDPEAPMPTLEAGDNYAVPSDMSTTDLTIPATAGLVVKSGAKLTVNGTLTNQGVAANLVILDGGQLVYIGSDDVNLTMQKSIVSYEAYSGTSPRGGSWYLITAPLATATPDSYGLITDTYTGDEAAQRTYDLYSFDDNADGGLEWRNYRAAETPFSLVANQGYLYANKSDMTINFAGQLVNHNGDVSIESDQAGWVLYGNPFPCKAYLNDANTNLNFYRMNADGDGFIAATGAINPLEGVFVKATAADQSFNFSRTQNSTSKTINVQVSKAEKNAKVSDRAIIRFDESSMLEKFMLNENGTKIYVTLGSKDYAVVRSNGQGETPVNFKAAENGTYTLSVDAENLDLNYLHLIDNKAGKDVDLLATPSYSFEARTTDYASRFRLVFSANNGSNENGNETFAYYNGSEWVISNMGDATLQVVDVMGRVLSSETVSGNANVSLNQTPGVYMLRLVNNENVRTQKIVVR